MSSSAIYDAFAAKVSTFAAEFSPPMRVAFPGVGVTPPTTGQWLEVRWFPNASQNYGLSDDAPTLSQGLGQVSVCYRPGGGIVAGLALAELVIAEFGKGTMLADVRVYQRPWVSSVLEEPDRTMHPVTIPWRGFDA
jgi:hypothetical protein